MSELSNQPAPRFVVCKCLHCDGHIEFDANEFSEDNNIVVCPHCSLETKIFVPALQTESILPELPPPVATPGTVRHEGFFDGASETPQQSASDGHRVASPQMAATMQPPANLQTNNSQKPQRKATEAQLEYIRGLGGSAPPNLNISDASRLIDQLLHAPDVEEKKQAAREQKRHEAAEREQKPAFYLRQDYEEAKRILETAERGEIQDAKMALKDAQDQRLWFWQDTFLSPCNMEGLVTEQSVRLYLEHGHRFKRPSEKRILAILELLDAHSPSWDKDGTVSFYLTLEASFPELLKKEIDYKDLEMDKEWLNSKFR
jgi:hypothetical protein